MSKMAGVRKPTLQDYFDEPHFEAVISKLGVNSLSRLFSVLSGLKHEDISQLLQPIGGGISVHQQAKNVFIAWIEANGDQATRQAVLIGLEKSGFNMSKDNLKEHWKGQLDQKCELPNDIDAIINIGQLAWNDLYKMFLNIGLKDFQIHLHSGGGQDSVSMKSRKVFDKWMNTRPRPTIRNLMDALKSIDNLDAAQRLAKEWDIPIEDIS